MNNISSVVGIDPGLSGGIVIYLPESKRSLCYPMPTHKVKYTGNKKGYREEIDLTSLKSILSKSIDLGCSHLFVEKVSSGSFIGNRKAGATSSFRFGQGFGEICGVSSVIFGENYVRKVSPVTWKNFMGLSKGKNNPDHRKNYLTGDKKDSIRLALELFPNNVKDFTVNSETGRKKDMDGIAEAALIGFYGYKTLMKEKY